MNRQEKKRVDVFEKLYKKIRKNTKAYYKKETMDLIKHKYSDMWTTKRSLKDKEIEIANMPVDAEKEIYYIASSKNK